MSSNEPFFRTTLSPKQRENLRLLLQLRSDEEARIAEERITDVLVFCHYAELRRRKFPKVTEAREKLGQIRAACKRLEALLRKEPVAESLFSKAPVVGEPHRMSSLSRRQRESRDERDQLCSQLRAVTDRSDRQLKSDTYFRVSNLLPPAWLTKAQSPTEAVFLWPELLRIWEESGQRVGDTRTGRLKGFFDLVHEVAGLPPPAESSLRSAVRRYRTQFKAARAKG